MFERAAICTDLTQSSQSVVSCAGALGDLGVREAVLIHVIDVRSASMGELAGGDVFSRQAELLEAAGIRVSIDAAVGYPAYEIETVADRHEVDLVVIGSHRKGLYPSPFSGSTSSDVVRISSRPVLIVALEILGSPEQSKAVCSRLLRSALFLTDLSSRSELASRYVLALARKGLQKAELLHVVPIGERSPADRVRVATERLESLAAELATFETEAVVAVAHGAPAAVAAQRVRGGSHSLVVIAPHKPAASFATLESVTNAVLKNTTAPVLVIPPHCMREPSS